MCSCNERPPDAHPWRDALNAFVWRHRDDIRGIIVVAVGLAAVAGALAYRFSPTDIERAEADLVKARAIVCALDDESEVQQKEAAKHSARASEFRKIADENKDTKDTPWLEWHRAMADGHSQLYRAKRDRRDNLTHLTAVYLRLIAEAECEILRAKDARNRGTPYKVTPRVRDILAPILNPQ
jgi:hypothetical protein